MTDRARHRDQTGSVLPVLVDHHVHLGLFEPAALASRGIGAVVDLGWNDEITSLAVRSQCAVAYAGQYLAAPGGYPFDRTWAPAGAVRAVASPAEAADAVDEQRRLGASLIKVTLHPGAGPVLDPATLRAIVDAAGESPVVAHAEGDGTVELALASGVAALAHTPWTDLLPPALVQECAAAGQRWISTLDIHGYGTSTSAQGRALDNLRTFHEAGGSVLYGTDLGNGLLPVGVNPREIELLEQAGLDRAAVVTSLIDPWPGLPRRDVCTFVPDGSVDRTAQWLQAARMVPVAEVGER